jgi:Transglycosylase SLT domain
MSIHRPTLVRVAMTLLSAVLMAPAAPAADWKDLAREIRDSQGTRHTDSAQPLDAEQAGRLWDAFLTSVVKHAGRDAGTELLRNDLLTLLISDRYEIIQSALGPDGGRWLTEHFAQAWPRIQPVLDHVAAALPSDRAASYRDLLSSGQILAAARSHGLLRGDGVSADTLRSLADKLAPGESGDPLAWSPDVDPELRQIFGFEAELPVPSVSPLLPHAESAAFLVSPLALIARVLEGAGDWLVPTANAAASGWDWHTLVTRLNDWVPDGKRELGEYLPMVQQMLDSTAHTLAARRLPPEHFDVYRDLVVATAWQESCWRQYTMKGGHVAPVVGPGPSFGLMQVNTRAWRGLYDARGVTSDIGYNARAGAEILYHYMRTHAIRGKEHLAPGGEDNLARATYAAYNGGPGHLTRYRNASTSPRLRAVDTEFWQKFQAVESDDESAFFSCAVKG